MTRSLFLLALLLAPLVAVAADKPNIILILADDLGARDLACFGSTYYETPNLDRFAARGVRLTRAYSASKAFTTLPWTSVRRKSRPA
jgi:arylsulfatase A